MPYGFDTHVLTVDANLIHKVDTANPQNLLCMWTVFSRCADSVEQGRRLENLSWRLWNSQTLRGENTDSENIPAATSQPKNIPTITGVPEIPRLSESVDSVLDNEEAVEITSESGPLEIQPRIQRQDSCTSSRSRGRQGLRSDEFEKMVVSIIREKEDNLFKEPLPELSIATPPVEKEVEEPTMATPTLERSGSTTAESSETPSQVTEHSSQSSASSCTHSEQSQDLEPSSVPSHPVTRGFSPQSVVTLAQRPSPLSQATQPETPIPAQRALQPKKPATFTCGGSYSSSDQGQSVEFRRPQVPQSSRRALFQMGGASGSSDEESSLRSALHQSRPGNNLVHKKQTSFNKQVTVAEAAIDDQSETEAEYVDESAIDDDDDSSDWEDSVEDSNKSSIDEKTYFQRVDSTANLTSRRSLITLMLAQNDRAQTLSNTASQSTSAIHRPRGHPGRSSLAGSPNDSDEPPLMMKGMRPTHLRPINEIPRSTAQPILATGNHGHYQAALSPRTTRRNMLAEELTESLRRHLLWERQQKSSTANAVLKRRHTSHDVANLKQYPEKPYMSKAEDVNASSWNQYFSREAFGEYHSKGW